jgi:hypothetical protein
VGLACPGTAYCAAYPSSATPPSCGAVTAQQQQVSLVGSQLKGEITISALAPASNYCIYCVAISSSGPFMTSYSEMLEGKLTVHTKGIKTVTVTVGSSAIPSGMITENILKVTVNASPREHVVLTFAVLSSTGEVLPNACFPSSITITSSSWTKTTSISLNSLPPGRATVLVRVSSDEYTTRILPTAFVEVNSPTTEPSQVLLAGAMFTSDGGALEVTFSLSTDRGQMSGSSTSNPFRCDTLFSFIGANSATCEWLDDANVWVTPHKGLLLVGDMFTLLPGRLRPKCTLSNTTICKAWETAPLQSRNVSAPTTLSLPVVLITCPLEIGHCSSLLLDLYSSTGSGGRAWLSYLITVGVSGSGADEHYSAVLNSFFEDTYRFSPPTVIPPTLLPPEGRMNFRVVLCNFLSACGVATVSVRVNSQLGLNLQTLGKNYLITTSRAGLALEVVAKNSLCVNNNTTREDTVNLQYRFEVFALLEDQSLVVTNLSSISSDPRKLKLYPYSLTAGQTYDIKVTVTNLLSGENTSAAVEVLVAQGVLVAMISGASRQTLAPNTTLVICGASSFDENVPTTENMLFHWRCSQSYPTLEENCELVLTPSGNFLQLFAPSSIDIGTCFQVTLQIFDATGDSVRSSDAVSLEVCIGAPNCPGLSISRSGESIVLNPSQVMTLYGRTQVSVSASVTVVWSTTESSVPLNASLTPVSETFTSNRLIQLPLVLPPDSLVGRLGSYPFILTVDGQGNGPTATISILVNSPPSGGKLDVTPKFGISLVTTYNLVALAFTDLDLPLSNEFRCQVSPESPVTSLQGRSGVASVWSLLPTGVDTNNYTISTSVLVYDSFSAFTTLVVKVRATPSTSQLPPIVNGTNVDEAKALIDLHGAALNSVSCHNSPNCSFFHRSPCSTTPNTCGSCVEGYVGTNGHDNSECLIATTVSKGVENPPSCQTSTNCAPWSSCVDSTCHQTSQSCIEPTCSGRGVCRFFDSNTGSRLSDCFVGDPYCQAECQCQEGSFGELCDQTFEEYHAQGRRNEDLLSLVQSWFQIDENTLDRAVSWIETFRALSWDSNRLTPTSVDLLRNLTVALLDKVVSLEIDYENLVLLFHVVESTARNLTSSNASNTAQFFVPWDQVCSTIQKGMVPGQKPIEYLTKNCQIIVLAADSPSSYLTVPQTALASALNLPSSTILLEADLVGELVPGISVTQYPLAWAQTNETCLSNVLRVSTSNSSRGHHFTVVLQHVELATEVTTSPSTFHTICSKRVEEVRQFVCVYPNSSINHTITHVCNGTSAHLLQTQCPDIVKEVSCILPDRDPSTGAPLPVNYDCQVKEHNPWNTTCLCHSVIGVNGRSLSSQNENDETAVTLGVSTRDTMAGLHQTRVQQFDSADDVNSAFSVMIFHFAFWLVVVASLVLIYFDVNQRY